MDEAKAIQKEMANIDNLKPCDLEMVMLFKMIEVQLLLAEDNYKSAENRLNISQECLDKMGSENLFHYRYNKGVLCVNQYCHEEGHDFFMQAYKLMKGNKALILKDEGWLYYYIALCYSYIEIPYHAVSFWQKARRAYPENRTTDFIFNTDRGIALNYIKMNQLSDAEELLNNCLVMDESIRNDNCRSYTLFCFGYMYKKARNWKAAIEYFNKSLEYASRDTIYYYSSVYHKIQCIIHTRAFTKANELLEQVKAVCKADNVWAVYFEALGHYLKISSSMTSSEHDESIKYIINIAIPHSIKMHDYLNAVDYYSLLGRHYEKLKNLKKSSLMDKAILNIYTRCYVNLEGEIKL